MSSIERRPPRGKTRERVLVEFGLMMALVLVCIGGVLLWKERVLCLGFFGGAGVFLVPAVFAPKALDPLERVWMKFADVLSVVMTYLVVTLTFYLVVTPIGILRRVCTNDPLGMKFDASRETYWVPVEEDAPGTRPYLPY